MDLSDSHLLTFQLGRQTLVLDQVTEQQVLSRAECQWTHGTRLLFNTGYDTSNISDTDCYWNTGLLVTADAPVLNTECHPNIVFWKHCLTMDFLYNLSCLVKRSRALTVPGYILDDVQIQHGMRFPRRNNLCLCNHNLFHQKPSHDKPIYNKRTNLLPVKWHRNFTVDGDVDSRSFPVR